MKTRCVADQDRAPMDAARLQAAIARPGGLWRQVEVVAQTGSTNADLLERARAGEPEGLVLAAESQTAGRGRLGRQWSSAAGAGLTFSVLLRPASIPPSGLGWLPLLAGVAIAAALREVAGVSAVLKWPNDVLAGGRKLAGVLAEGRAGAIVVGIGLNVWHQVEELPVGAATSLSLAGGLPAGLGREELLAAVLGDFGRWYLAWRDQARPGDPDQCGLRGAYLGLCGTLGREVTVTLPPDRAVTGTATGIGPGGQLRVSTAGGPLEVSAGDVIHLR